MYFRMCKYPLLSRTVSAVIAIFVGFSAEAQDEKEGLALKRQQLDEGVWADQVLGETYGATIIDLWDKLREAEKPLEVLQTYRLGVIEKPHWKLNRRLPEKIFEFLHKAPSRSLQYLKSYQLQTLINQYIEEGYNIDQVDFRHIGFEVSANGAATSRVEFEFNVSGPSHTLYRRSFRGVARINWGNEKDDDGLYSPKSISFEELRQYRRTGKTIFKVRDWLGGSDNRSSYVYLLVEDFDLDGRPDILFPRENMLYRNVGDFRFDPRPFLKHFTPDVVDSALFVDIDLDGVREYITATRGVGVLVFEPNRKTGKFDQKPKLVSKLKSFYAPQSMSGGDVNGDGLPDLFIGQHMEPYVAGLIPTPYYDSNDGLASRLLLNQGNLKFKESIANSGLAAKARRRNRSSSIVDLDQDGSIDLVLTNNFGRVDVFSGDGEGLLEDRSSEWLDKAEMLGAAHLISDFNRDGRLDLFAFAKASEFAKQLEASGVSREGFEESEAKRSNMMSGSRLWFGQGDGEFDRFEDGGSFSRSGWIHGAAEIDFNNDGMPDVYLTNGYISKETARDYEERFWRHDLYDSESESKVDIARHIATDGPGRFIKENNQSWAPFQKNQLWANFGEDGFVDIAYLMGASRELDGRATVAVDLNQDGKPDLISLEIDSVEHELNVKILENTMVRVGNWIGVQLKPAKKRSTAGARVRLIGEDFETVKANVFGDAYSAQTSSMLHFGIGSASSVKAIEIVWADGVVSRITSPGINRYHAIAPGE